MLKKRTRGSSELRWNAQERAVFRTLNRPSKIQSFLDEIRYNITDKTLSPRGVLAERVAHCFDGALFAAAALEFHGYHPFIIDLRSNAQDDDHVLAIFKQAGLFGAIGKSNYTGCRYRDPVFRTLRELAMSYFNIWFNLAGRKTLREYSVLFDLEKVRDVDWRYTAEDLTPLGERLDGIRHYYLISRQAERNLADADDRLFRAETLGLNPKGAFQVKGARKL